jgi:hypothetical protein
MATRLDVDLVPSRSVAIRTVEAQLVEMELRYRNPGSVVASDSNALGGEPPSYYAPAAYEVFTTAGRPAAGASWLGKTIIVRDTSSPSQVETCVQVSGGGYEWVIVAMSSS